MQYQPVNAVTSTNCFETVVKHTGGCQLTITPPIAASFTNLKGVGTQDCGIHLQVQPEDTVATVGSFQTVPVDIAASRLLADGYCI